MKNIMLLGIVALLMGCTQQQKAQQVSISGTEWKLVKMAGEDFSAMNPRVTITFDENQKKVNGHGGCNKFFGSYTLTDSFLTINGMGSTKMFCQETQGIEDRYFKALEQVQSFKIVGGKLVLLSADEAILEFAR